MARASQGDRAGRDAGGGLIPKLADPDSPCVNSSGTSIAKTYGGPMTYGQSARAPTLAKMSQAFRSLVLRDPATTAGVGQISFYPVAACSHGPDRRPLHHPAAR